MASIVLSKVNKTYRTGKLQVPVLHDINLTIGKGEMIAIMGPSGSGKSTLMNLIGLLDRPSEGEIRLDDQPLRLSMPDGRLAALRSKKIGFVFQSFHLLPRFSSLDNVLLPTLYIKSPGARVRAKKLLKQLGLADRMNHLPTEMSGGERQRVAIARALINDPEIILADEPTGNLDSKSGKEVMQILTDLNKEGKTVVVITHDPAVAAYCQRVVTILDGKLQEGERHVS